MTTPSITDRKHEDGTLWSFGTGGVGGRYGGAHRCGTVNLHGWRGASLLPVVRAKCSSYRKAQRKLLQYLKGY